MAQPLLTPPWGHGSGDHVSLRLDGVLLPDSVRDTLLAYSCYPPAIPKILACLEQSGRYDCVVQPIWFRRQFSSLSRRLAELGITITIFELCDNFKGRMR